MDHEPAPDERFDAILASYLEAERAGRAPDRHELLVRHPEFATELATFFADHDRLKFLAEPSTADDVLAPPESSTSHEPSPGERVRYFGDYELLEEIARGGMGIVYKARQVSLNRSVALKMILKGTFATPRDVARFRGEAESAAVLDHPNIVPIYEVGEHDGHQYYAMRLIDGRPLSQLPRADARTETQRLATIARAVHYAHQRGVLHRDLKPSNILQSSSDPRTADQAPLITDFGLAKRLGADGSLTESGQIVGTPKYMAPEQAAGRKDLTTAADIYGLGVILYERLTGRTPFTGDDPLTILRQVRESEPPRPSSITAGIDRDLETVVLKCLEKEPAKRYASAAELADDLDSWQRGEPILARPVGQAERFRRWCRRNPTVAGLTGAVAAALVVGTVVSTGFAIVAERRREKAEVAERAERTARDELEGEFARSFITPLNPDGHETAMNEPETEALWRLSAHDRYDLRVRFLQEATRDTRAIRQLAARVEPALIAALGLDYNLRNQAARMLAERIDDPELTSLDRAYVALAAIELDDSAEGPTKDYARYIEKNLLAEPAVQYPAYFLTNAHTHLPAPLAVRLLISSLVDPSLSPWDFSARVKLLSPRLQPVEASFAAQRLADLLEREPNVGGAHYIADALDALASHLEPTRAAHIAGVVGKNLAKAIERENDHNSIGNLAQTVASIAGRLDATDAAYVALEVARRLEGNQSNHLVDALQALASRLDPVDAAAIGRKLAASLKLDVDIANRNRLAAGIQIMARRIERIEANRLCLPLAQQFAELIERETNGYAALDLAKGLAVLADSLEPLDAARVCSPAARALASALKQPPHSSPAEPFSKPKPIVINNRGYLAEGFVLVAIRLDPAEAGQLISDAIVREEIPPMAKTLADALASIGRRLPAAHAARLANPAAHALGAALQKNPAPDARRDLALALAAVAGCLEPDDMARVCAESAKVLSAAVQDESNDSYRLKLLSGLMAIVRRLNPVEAVQILAASFEREKNGQARNELAMALAATAERMERVPAARVCRPVAETIVKSVQGDGDYYGYGVVDSIRALASQLQPADAAVLCADAVQQFLQQRISMGRTDNYRFDREKSISALVHFLPSRQRDYVVRQIAFLICSEADSSWADPDSERDRTDTLRVLLTDSTGISVTYFVSSTTVVNALSSPLLPRPFLPAAAEPLPCRLTTQELVELLKMPTCFGPARRVVLDQLENRYKRRFCNHWAFVRYAQENGLNLDFTTPPKRPSRTLTWPEN